MSLDPTIMEQEPRQPRDNQFRFVFNLLAEHWLLILACAIVGALLFGSAAWLRREVHPVRYKTHAEVVIVPSQWEKGLLKEVSGISFSVAPRTLVERTNLHTLAQEITRALIQRDIAVGGEYSRLTTKEEFVAMAADVEGKISMLPLDESNKIRIEVNNCETPAKAERISEFAVRVFLEQNRQLRLEEGKETHAFIQDELKKLRQQLFEAETAEWNFKQEMGFREIGKVDQEMARLYEELNEKRVTRDEILDKLEELDGTLAANTQDMPESLGQVTDSVVTRLFTELDTLLQEQLTLSGIYQPGFPELQNIEEEIAEKQQTILEALKRLDTGVAGGSNIWKKRQEIYRQRIDLRLRLTELDIRIASLERMLEEMMPQIPELANKNLEYEKLAQETESIRKRFEKLRQREWELRTALSHGAGQIERYESVRRASTMPISGGANRLWVNFVIGAVVGLLCGFLFVMVRELNDTSIRSIEDVNEYIGLDVIGTIPKMRFGRPRGGRRRRATYVTTVDEEQIDACIVTQHDPKSPISEAYRTLRTNYQFATIKEQPRTLMVTSAVPGEGKTTTAANMAVTMADRGMRVLIVDTDLRRPNVHRVLRMERGPGLADVLREGLDPKSVIRPTRIENLWIISSGRVPPNPSELLGSARMAELMQQLGAEFDLVICDAPSVLVVTDPVLLATHVETCIMVVSTNNARRETVVRAKKLLETANVNVVGVVVNGLETTRRHYYYYYYYYDDGSPVRRKWYHFY